MPENPLKLNDNETKFLEKSQDFLNEILAEKKRAEEERREQKEKLDTALRSKLRTFKIGCAISLALLALATFLGFRAYVSGLCQSALANYSVHYQTGLISAKQAQIPGQFTWKSYDVTSVLLSGMESYPELNRFITPEDKYAWCSTFLSDDKVVVGFVDGTMSCIGTDGKILWTSPGHSGKGKSSGRLAVMSLAYDQKSGLLVSVGCDSTVRLWDSSGRQIDKALVETQSNNSEIGNTNIYSVAINPDGTEIATAGKRGAHLFKLKADRILYSKTLSREPSYSVGFSPSGKSLVVGGANLATLWNKPFEQKELRPDHYVNQVSSICFAGNSVFLGSTGGYIDEYDVPTGEYIRDVSPNSHPVRAMSAWKGEYLAVGGETEAGSGYIDVYRLDGNHELEVTLAGHRARVTSIAYSPQGQLVSVGGDHCILWNRHLSHRLARRRIPVGGTISRLVNVGGVVKALDATGSLLELADVPNVPGIPSKVCILDDGAIALGSSKGKIDFLSPSDLTKKGGMSLSVKGSILDLKSLPDGALAAATSEGKISIMNPRLGSIHQLVSASPASEVNCIAVNSSGRILAAGDDLGTVQVWRLPVNGTDTDNSVGNIISRGQEPVRAIAFGEKDKRLTWGTEECKLVNYDLETSILRETALEEWPQRIEWLGNGVALLDSRENLRYFVTEPDGIALREVREASRKQIRAFAHPRSDDTVITAPSVEGGLQYADRLSNGPLFSRRQKFSIVESGAHSVVAVSSGSVFEWPDGNIRNEPLVHSLCDVRTTDILENGPSIISGDTRGFIKFTNLAEKPRAVWSKQVNGLIQRARFVDREGDSVTLTSDGELDFWGPQGDMLLKLNPKDTSLVEVSPDFHWLATAGDTGAITLRSLENFHSSRKLSYPKVLEGHTTAIQALSFSPDGRLLASSSGDRTIRIWNVVNGNTKGATLTGHSEAIKRLAFSPQRTNLAGGFLLASGDATGRICLWDAEYNRMVGNSLQMKGEILNLCFSANGKSLYANDKDQLIEWSLDSVNWQKLAEGLIINN